MRLFVALELPDEIKQKIQKTSEKLRQELDSNSLSIVKPENMHLTLRFIGEVDEKTLEEIDRRLKQIKFKPVDCSVKGVGVFPNEKHAKVIWVGIESSGKLESLATQVIQSLRGIGKEDRIEERFSAHITIARMKRNGKRKIELDEFLANNRTLEFGEVNVQKFELIESKLKPEGAEYIVLKEYKLSE
ncbi:RNA 2',3'-cyclic phosphodiesterase [Candidatus Micrarchaeota archaeon]|nr:RNA 2',3'-cyclic phosphodiesterase [Candidatus Micrarchaeota archaeon]